MSYTLKLTEDEHRTLAWVADRYVSAEVLYDGAEHDYDEETGETTFTVPEHVAWEYRDALYLDNGVEGAVLPPCVGGTLAEKLLSFYDSIV